MMEELSFFTIEKKYPELNEFEINGVPIWPFFRNYVKFELLTIEQSEPVRESGELVSAEISTTQRKASFLKNIYYNYLRIQKDVKRYLRLFGLLKSPDFMLISNKLEKKQYRGYSIDKLATGLIKTLGPKKFLLLEDGILLNKEKFLHKEVPMIETTDIDHFMLKISDVSLKFTNGSLTGLNKILKEIGLKDVEIGHFQYFFKRAHVMTLLYKRYRPKVLFTACYSYYADIFAAKKMGIKTVELQHGIIAASHTAYYSPLKIESTCTSDNIFTFGDRSFNTLENCIYSSTKKFSVGNYYLELLKNDNLDEKIRLSRFSHSKYNIAVPSDYISEGELVDFIVPIARKNLDLVFHIIPRDGLQAATSKKIEGVKNIKVILNMSFHEIVRYCDVNTSTDSTCCLEALNLGIPNILYNIDNKAYRMFHDKVDPKFTHFITDPNEYIEILTNELTFNNDAIILSQVQNFRPHYTENIVEAVEKVLLG